MAKFDSIMSLLHIFEFDSKPHIADISESSIVITAKHASQSWRIQNYSSNYRLLLKIDLNQFGYRTVTKICSIDDKGILFSLWQIDNKVLLYKNVIAKVESWWKEAQHLFQYESPDRYYDIISVIQDWIQRPEIQKWQLMSQVQQPLYLRQNYVDLCEKYYYNTFKSLPNVPQDLLFVICSYLQVDLPQSFINMIKNKKHHVDK